MPKITVIMPVYRTEEYLEAAVRSVLAQSFPDWELILVDDGSPDRSGELCDALAREDARIRVIHQQNGGVSRARNAGLKAAEGEYIAFLDSDDLYTPDALSWYLEKKESSGADFICCAFAEITGETLREACLPLPEPLLPSEDFLFRQLTGVYGLPLSCCTFFFSRDSLAGLRFAEGRAYGEDTLFLCSALKKGTTVYYEPKAGYLYRVDRAGNTLSDTGISRLKEISDAYGALQELFAAEGLEKLCRLLTKIRADAALRVCHKAKLQGEKKTAAAYRKKAYRLWKACLPFPEVRAKDKLRIALFLLSPGAGMSLAEKRRA